MVLDTRTLRSERHAEVGALIQRDAALIVDDWCRRARRHEAAARALHHEALRDSLPQFLDAVGRSLEQTGDADPDARKEAAVEHGAQRWQHGWSVTDVIRDYQLLRVVIQEYAEEHLRRALATRESLAIGVFIDDAIAASVQRFVSHMEENLAARDNERRTDLEEEGRRREAFLAVLSHELRSPIAPIQNCLRVVSAAARGTGDRALSASVAIIERQTALLVRLVDDLYDMARVRRGEFELKLARVDLKAVLENALQMTDAVFAERRHKVDVLVPAERLTVEADFARLSQVVVNLLNNAAKYTAPEGNIIVVARREAEHIILSVRDDGIGIAADELPTIFELFARAGGSEPERPDGLGIGLAIVKTLVEQHGGSIVAESPGPGRGTEFCLRLPAVSD